ncbi:MULTISPECIES: class I SAM-dependent methyltransferase [unclassified Kribbella]|uniref:class I SAM-dependent methyltransferase n=1 Tax=unclassified Kribbella TaxID=2644121 RepID=UPI0037B27AD7|nr:class I SAM-dependent methyltransferase [Kribbella sp. NBC_00889]
MTDRLARIARGWDEAAAGYEVYFVPRFAPWVRTAVDAVGDVPDGPILVPCCGTFPELDLLAPRFPGRRIVGIDLSAGMVRLARERAARLPDADVELVQGDAATLDPRWLGFCAAVVSVFGLQQLPDPRSAIASWYDALRPGGRLCVVYWPDVAEETGPFALLDSVVGDNAGRPWEDELVPALAGAEIERDEMVSHPMTHPDAATYFDAVHRAGPLRALALAHGDDYMAELRMQYLERAPVGEWTHHPSARLIVVRRPPSRAAGVPPTSG